MKKIFTFIAAAFMAVGGVNAETLINYSASQTGITLGGSTEFDAVKINTNKTSVNGIKFANSYTSNNASNGNHAELTVEGGFKAGDVITIAGVFNNADNTKLSAVDIFTLEGTTPTVLWTSQQFVNGRLVDDAPVEETYVLTADVEKLYIGRNGNTTTFITTLKVVRGEEDEDNDVTTGSGLIDYPTLQTGITLGGSTEFDAVKINTNKTSVNGIKFANSYTSNNASNGNHAELTVEGGFKAGDVITIAGVFNNADNTKLSAVDIFTLEGTTPTVLWTSQQFVNGRLVDDAPVEETYVLTADVEKLYIGRNGNTTTFVTKLKVERTDTGTGVKEVLTVKATNGAIYNLAGQQVDDSYKGIVIKNGKKYVQK